MNSGNELNNDKKAVGNEASRFCVTLVCLGRSEASRRAG